MVNGEDVDVAYPVPMLVRDFVPFARGSYGVRELDHYPAPRVFVLHDFLKSGDMTIFLSLLHNYKIASAFL